MAAFRFGIRDFLWAMMVLSLWLAWSGDQSRHKQELDVLGDQVLTCQQAVQYQRNRTAYWKTRFRTLLDSYRQANELDYPTSPAS